MKEKPDFEKIISRLSKRDSARKAQQEEDQKYYDDDFPVAIVDPFHIVRTGSASRIVTNAVTHIEAANPQAFRKPRKNTEDERQSVLKVSRMLNIWLHRINPQIIDTVWDAVLRGEGIFQIEFNSNAYGKSDKDYIYLGNDLPILITAVDPMTCFCLPYDALIPSKVAKEFSIDADEIAERYPQWTNPKKRQAGNVTGVKYRAYWDKDWRYFSGDAEELKGEKNILGFCPFVHFYSGFGKRSPDGKPEFLAVGILKKIRGLLKEECEMASRIDSIIAIYANPIYKIEKIDLNAPNADEKALERQVIGPGQTLVVPHGYKAEIYTPDVATAQLFAHQAQIRAQLGLVDPLIMSGIASSSRVSGRQEDIEYGHIEKKYRSLVRNLAEALEALLGIGLKILDTQPQALPITVKGEVIKKGEKVLEEFTVTKEDIDGYYECEVKLNPEESLEDDRNFMKNRILANEGRISWKRFLMEGLNLTEWEADEIIAEALAEQAIMNSPLMKAAREQEAIERMGATRYIKKAQEDASMKARMEEELKAYTPKLGGQVRPSEATNPQALSTVRQLLGGETPVGVRKSPQGGEYGA